MHQECCSKYPIDVYCVMNIRGYLSEKFGAKLIKQQSGRKCVFTELLHEAISCLGTQTRD